jgi:predicted RNase H-like HicB family nuclease
MGTLSAPVYDTSWPRPFSRMRSRTTMTAEHRYEVGLYWSDDDQAFIDEIPELPGCVSDGPTYAAAVESIERAITRWIETARELGRPIPVPRARARIAQA